jgi:hypothetical protein
VNIKFFVLEGILCSLPFCTQLLYISCEDQLSFLFNEKGDKASLDVS